MQNKPLIYSLLGISLVAGLLLSVSAPAAQNPIDYRRTLFVRAGQKTLVFEAPQRMCFLDKTQPFESALYNAFQGQVQKNNDRVLLAVFSDCDAIASLGGASGTNNIPLNSGTISWLAQSVGETTPLDRGDYLDMRGSSLPQYLKNSPVYSSQLKLDETTHRTPENVSLGMSGEMRTSYEKQHGIVVIATTTLRHMPIETMIRFTGKNAATLEKTYQLMDKFMMQQIALNE
ncbi:MAG: hypothetical protein HY052_03405 [Proteobacteria bacterium]|nr:hypothetical protein [Pseudomonadota bacterium]